METTERKTVEAITFVRPEARKEITFVEDLIPGNAKSVKTYISSKGNAFAILTVSDGTQVRIMADSLSLLQDENQASAILVNADGKVAGKGEECSFNTKLLHLLGAKKGKLYLAA